MDSGGSWQRCGNVLETQSSKAGSRRHLADLTPLKESPQFARLWIGNVLNGLGTQLTLVAVALQIFDISKSTTAVALVGGIALIPMVLAGPIGGMITDAFDRRLVMIVSASVMFSATAGLFVLSILEQQAVSYGGHTALWPFYVCTTMTAVSATVLGGARQAVIPRILPKDLLTRASALNGISMGTQIMAGPALAGILVAVSTYSVAFACDLALTATGFLGIAMLPKIKVAEDAIRPGWKSFKESMDFLKTAPHIRAGFVVDIIAMGLGRPYVLLPAAAASIIGGGPITVGILTAAGAAGSFATSAFSGRVVHIRMQGLAIANSVKVYGLFTALFGGVLLVMESGDFGHPTSSLAGANLPALVLAAMAFFGMGASDEVSAIFRTSMLLSSVPDQMRGRLQGIFLAVVGGGPRLGDIYAGVMAAAVGLWAGPLFGGIGIVLAMFLILRVTPRLREFQPQI
jgi:MFS family permease